MSWGSGDLVGGEHANHMEWGLMSGSGSGGSTPAPTFAPNPLLSLPLTDVGAGVGAGVDAPLSILNFKSWPTPTMPFFKLI